MRYFSFFFYRITSLALGKDFALLPNFVRRGQSYFVGLACGEKIQSFFGVGKLTIRNRGSTVTYSVKSLKELYYVIIPHFSKYPLLTLRPNFVRHRASPGFLLLSEVWTKKPEARSKKKLDFELFKSAIELMINKQHLTEQGLPNFVRRGQSYEVGLACGENIFSIRASLGKGLSTKLASVYPDLIPAENLL